jgi:hypothetical protein
VERADKLASDRPDLAAKERKGEVKPAESHRQLKQEKVAEKFEVFPAGKLRVIYADPPWSCSDKQAVLSLMRETFQIDRTQRLGKMEIVNADGTQVLCDLVLMTEWKTRLPAEFLG